MDITFSRNEATGKVEVYKDGVYSGEIDTMGDEVIKESEEEGNVEGHTSG